MACESLTLEMPTWYESLKSTANSLTDDAQKLRFAVELSKQNVRHQSGGPFGAAIFCNRTNKLLAGGVNLVTTRTTSLAHAECVSIGIAQQKANSHDLSAQSNELSGDYTLYCSAQPCIMCFGAIWWSGIRRVVCAATASDVEELTGFFEGPVPENWESLLNNRAPLPTVTVSWGDRVLRDAARAILKEYKDSGAPIYNAGHP
jgi:tRNA(Arg) A34 adenosine deaminase TadA